jgi:hypothetical protein
VNFLQIKELIWSVTKLLDKALKYDVGEEVARVVVEFMNG